MAAARVMESTNASTTAVTTAGTTIAAANDAAGTATITQPQGPTGSEAQSTINQKESLPFAGVFGLSNGSVSATAVAQVQTEATQVADGQTLDPGGCSRWCEYIENSNPAIGVGDWHVTAVAEDPDTGTDSGISSADLQSCGGGIVGNTCTSPTGNQVNSQEVVDLNGDVEGGMYETVTTVPGAQYVLGFWLSGNPAGNNSAVETFTGDVQIKNGTSQYTPNCAALASGYGNSTCECPSSPTSVIACLFYTHTDNIVNGSSTQSVSFQTESVSFTAQSSQTTITFNSSTNDGGYFPWCQYGPEVTDITLSYPGDALVQ
jgi:hypothetical protein